MNGTLNEYPINNGNDGTAENVDIGPMQMNFQTWGGGPNPDVRTVNDGLDIDAVFGTNRSGGQQFNGTPSANILAGGRILRIYTKRYGSRAAAAGYFRTGKGKFSKTKRGRDEYDRRVANFNSVIGAYDKFFRCMGL